MNRTEFFCGSERAIGKVFFFHPELSLKCLPVENNIKPLESPARLLGLAVCNVFSTETICYQVPLLLSKNI